MFLAFPTFIVPPTREIKNTCTTATETPTPIRATLEFTLLQSVLKTELENSYNYTSQQMESARMPFPSIFVPPMRVFTTTSNTAT